MRRLCLVVAVALVCTAACGGDDASDTSDGGEIIEVAFDGTECTIDAPASIEPGPHTMILQNSSEFDETSLNLYVNRLAVGYGWEDHAALWSGYLDGGTIPGNVEWSHSAMRAFGEPVQLAAGEKQFDYSLEPGTHAINLRREAPSRFWLCGPVEVAEG